MCSAESEQTSCNIHPRNGLAATLIITVADIARSARFYERVFGGRILSVGAVVNEVQSFADALKHLHDARNGRKRANSTRDVLTHNRKSHGTL